MNIITQILVLTHPAVLPSVAGHSLLKEKEYMRIRKKFKKEKINFFF